MRLSLVVDHVWSCSLFPSITRTSRVFSQEEPASILYHILTSGKYFLAFYGPSKALGAAALRLGAAEGAALPPPPPSHMVDIFDRASRTRNPFS